LHISFVYNTYTPHILNFFPYTTLFRFTPTWLEYIRHNGRATHADAVIGERIRALHSGSEPPHVRRMIERPTTAGTALVMAKGPIEH